MKRKNLLLILVAALVLSAFFVACKADIEAPSGELVDVTFAMDGSRALSATLEDFDPDLYYWKYAAAKNAADTSGLNSGTTEGYNGGSEAREAGALWIHDGVSGLSGTVPGFSQGLWDFTLYAYTNEGTSESPVYSLTYLGEAEAVSLVKSGLNKVHVVVSPAPEGNGKLYIGETTLNPKKQGDIPSVSRFLKVEDFDEHEYAPTSGTTYILPAGTYRVTVTYKASGITYADGMVIATVYPNMTTTVTGSVDELVTYAQFEAEQKIIERTAGVDGITSTTTGDEQGNINLSEPTTVEDKKISATVPAAAAVAMLPKVGENPDPNASMSLELNVDTTDSTSTSVTYEISMTKIVTLNSEVTTSDVDTLGTDPQTSNKYYAVATVKLSTGLTGVSVTHDGNPMVESESTGDDDGNGVFFYDASTGVLTIQTNTFSPFKVTYDGPIAGVAEVNGVEYPTLAAAFEALPQGGGTITLLSDAEGAGLFLPANLYMNIVLDLDGHTYTCTGPAVGSPGTENQAIHLEKNNTVTIKDGTITSTPDSGVSKMLVQNYCNLTLENVILDGSNVGEGKYTLSNNSGTVVLKGSTSIIPPHNGKALDSCKYGSYAIPNVTINTSGIIDGIIELSGGKLEILNGNFSGSISTESGYQEGDAVIKGGIFDYDPTAYVPEEGYKIEQIEGGKYVVLVDAEIEVVTATDEHLYMSLLDFAASVNAGNNYSGCTVNLLKDIDLDGAEWTPIGTEEYSFSGLFDGNDHVISGFKVTEGTAVGSRTYLGFFTKIVALDGNTAGVKNLTISDALYGDEGSSKPLGVICVYSTSDDNEESTILFQNITIDDVTVYNIGGWGNTGLAAVAAANHTVISGCDISIDFIIPAFAKQSDDYKFISPCIGQISADNSEIDATITFENNNVDGCTYSYDSSDLEAHGNNGTGHQTVWLYHVSTKNNTITAVAKLFGQIYKTGMTLIIDGETIPYDADHFFNPTSTLGCQMIIDRIIYTKLEPLAQE